MGAWGMHQTNSLVQEISQKLLAKHWLLGVAESCTAGGLAYALTEIPGSSAWFERGFVTYSNLAKEDMLAVPHSILAQYGAVSAETAKAMAEGVLQMSPADISLSITGIAGPDGGSQEKPVGTVWFACAHKGTNTITQLHHFTGNRHEIRVAAIDTALTLLLNTLS